MAPGRCFPLLILIRLHGGKPGAPTKVFSCVQKLGLVGAPGGTRCNGAPTILCSCVTKWGAPGGTRCNRGTLVPPIAEGGAPKATHADQTEPSSLGQES